MADEDTTTEEWRPVPIAEYAALYSVSSLGRVRRDITGASNAKAGRILKPSNDPYQTVSLCGGTCDRKRRAGIHILVAGAFLGPTPIGFTVDHENGVKHDNRARNLRFLTPKQQIAEADRLGLRHPPKGDGHSASVLTEADIPVIRKLLASGVSRPEIGRLYGVGRAAIHAIGAGKTWKHVK